MINGALCPIQPSPTQPSPTQPSPAQPFPTQFTAGICLLLKSCELRPYQICSCPFLVVVTHADVDTTRHYYIINCRRLVHKRVQQTAMLPPSYFHAHYPSTVLLFMCGTHADVDTMTHDYIINCRRLVHKRVQQKRVGDLSKSTAMLPPCLLSCPLLPYIATTPPRCP
jgi:hypothetical protein